MRLSALIFAIMLILGACAPSKPEGAVQLLTVPAGDVVLITDSTGVETAHNLDTNGILSLELPVGSYTALSKVEVNDEYFLLGNKAFEVQDGQISSVRLNLDKTLTPIGIQNEEDRKKELEQKEEVKKEQQRIQTAKKQAENQLRNLFVENSSTRQTMKNLAMFANRYFGKEAPNLAIIKDYIIFESGYSDYSSCKGAEHKVYTGTMGNSTEFRLETLDRKVHRILLVPPYGTTENQIEPTLNAHMKAHILTNLSFNTARRTKDVYTSWVDLSHPHICDLAE